MIVLNRILFHLVLISGLIACAVKPCICGNETISNSVINGQTFRVKLNRIEAWFPKLAFPIADQLKNLNPITLNASLDCELAYNQFLVNIRLGDKASLRILDASAKFRPGFVSKLEQSDFGYYAQCPIATHVHYFVELDWPLPDYSSKVDRITLIKNGTWLDRLNDKHKVYYYEKQVLMACLPSECSNDEYNTMALETTSEFNLPLRVNFINHDVKTDIISRSGPLKRISFALLSTLVAIIFCATLSKWFNDRSFFSPTLMKSLDIVENTSKLFRRSHNDKLAFLSGYRFVYCYIAIMCHMLITASVQTKYIQAKSVVLFGITLDQSFASLPFGLGAYMFRSSFMFLGINFALSGLLAYYSWAPILKATKCKISFTAFAIVRYIRTIPVIIVTLLMILAFPVQLGDGPIYRTTFNTVTTNCINSGWAEIFALSNFYNVDKIALPQAWFVSADFQIYLLSYLAILTLYNRSKLGMVLVSICIAIGILVHALVLSHFEAKYFLTINTSDFKNVMDEAVIHVHAVTSGISSYFVGIILGYLVVNNRTLNETTRIKPSALYILAGVLLILNILLSHAIDVNVVPPFIKYLLNPLMRTLLATILCNLFYMAWNGSIPVLSKLLSLRALEVMSKFSYSTFMVHLLVVWYHIGNMQHQFEHSFFNANMDVIAVYCVSNVLGYFVYLFVEAPAINIVKMGLSSSNKVIS